MSDTERAEFEVTLRKQNAEFLEAVSKTFSEAEDYLKLPRGTLVDIHKDIDFVAVMKMSSTIEPLINQALDAEIRRFRKMKVEDEAEKALADFVIKTPDRKRKAKLANKMGLIANQSVAFIEAIYEIRDLYAHNVINLPLSMVAVTEKAEIKNGKIWLNLAGMKTSTKHKRLLLALMMNSPIYYKFAQFLADALHVVKPPPFRGLLGHFAAEEARTSTDKSDPSAG